MKNKELRPLSLPSLTYDAAGQLTRTVDLTSSNVPFASFQDTYDPAGRRTHRINLDGDITWWSYDASSQLTREFVSDSISSKETTYEYDPVGNRRVLDDGVRIVTSTYDAANRLQTAVDDSGTTTYTYDPNGNQTSIEIPAGDITTYTWSYENQLQTVEDPEGEVVTYTYAPVTKISDELRYSKETDFGFTYYVWDNQNIILETDELGLTEAEYTDAPRAFGEMVSQHRNSESTFYHFDLLGSTAALTDPSQAVSDSYTYSAFGEVIASTGDTNNPYQWIGQVGYYHDETTGLYNLRRRDLNAAEGRFLSQDPFGLNAGDANFYRYVGNNVTNSIDPSGEVEIECDYVRAGYPQVTKIVTCASSDGKGCCDAVLPTFFPTRGQGATKWRTARWRVRGGQNDISSEAEVAAVERRRLEERLLAQATDEVINGKIPGLTMEVLFKDGHVQTMDRMTYLGVLANIKDEIVSAHISGGPGSLTTDPTHLRLTPSELESSIRFRYQRLISDYNHENGGALQALQFTLDLVGLLPVVGTPADLLNMLISLANGDTQAAGLSFLSAAAPIGGAAVLGTFVKVGLKADGLVEVAAKTSGAVGEAATKACAVGSDAKVGLIIKPLNPELPPAPPKLTIAPLCVNPSFVLDPKVWTRTAEFTPSTGRTYKVFQRNDINWDQIRKGGARDFIGKTNAEAAKSGLRPELPDLKFATLHHQEQCAGGPWFEASTRYHNIKTAKEGPLHPWGGEQHPLQPLGKGPGSLREQFQNIESPEYWIWREAHR